MYGLGFWDSLNELQDYATRHCAIDDDAFGMRMRKGEEAVVVRGWARKEHCNFSIEEKGLCDSFNILAVSIPIEIFTRS
jgi:hypothetical protein